MYNLMTCNGGTWSGCTIGWAVMALLLFVVLISRRQLEEFLGIEYNLIGGFIGAFVPYFLLITIGGWIKWGLLIGLIGSFVGGFMGGSLFGGGGSDYGY